MIENKKDCERFVEETINGNLILHVIPIEDGIHPIKNSISILFMRNMLTEKTYYFSVDHPDSVPEIEFSWFLNEVLAKNPNKKWAIDKKSFSQFINLQGIYDANMVGYLQKNDTFEISDYYTPAHHLIYRQSVNKVNHVIPLIKHKEMFDELADDITKLVKSFKIDESFQYFNDIIIGTLGILESQGVYVNRNKFKERFDISVGADGLVYSQYNVYTSTGRPSNRFNNVNYAALNQSDGTRECFCSRYGKEGKMVLIDYGSFHPRIICKLTNYEIPTDVDIYEYLAKLYFRKKEVDDIDIKNAKQLTFRQFFGGVEEEYSHIKYLSNLKTFIYEQWEFFKKNDYVLTPIFKRKITVNHIKEPNPPKVFNYILQAVEGEIAISKLDLVIKYLTGKQTRAILYTYDSILYDFHKEDGMETLNEIIKIMSFDGIFPMKTYIGDSYHDMKLIKL